MRCHARLKTVARQEWWEIAQNVIKLLYFCVFCLSSINCSQRWRRGRHTPGSGGARGAKETEVFKLMKKVHCSFINMLECFSPIQTVFWFLAIPNTGLLHP